MLMQIIDEENVGRGIVGRLCLAVCESLAGSRPAVSSPIPPEAQSDYDKLVAMLFDASAGYSGEPEKLAMSKEAQEYAVDYHNLTAEPRIRQAPQELAAWHSKSEGLAYRIAGIFHVIRCIWSGIDPVKEEIAISTIATACLIVDSIAEHMESALNIAGQEAKDAEYLLEKALKLAKDEGSQEAPLRSLLRAASWRLGKKDKFASALELLESKGYIKRGSAQKLGAKRPQAIALINPALLE